MLEWNLDPLVKDGDDARIEAELKAVSEAVHAFVEKWNARTDYLEDPAVLQEALAEFESLARTYGTDGAAGYYASLRSQQNLNDPEIRALANRVQEFSLARHNELQFFELRLAKVPEEKQADYLAAPELAPYRHFLSRLFAEAAHLLSEPEEKILNLASPTSYQNWIQMTAGLLAKQEREVLREDGTRAAAPFAEIASLTSSVKKPVRDGAAGAFNEIVAQYRDIAEQELNSVLAYKKMKDDLRGYQRPDGSRHLHDDIASSVVDALLAAVSSRNETSARYYRLKADLFGVPKLAYHERNVPYGSVEKKYTYEEAAELVGKVLGKLHPRFAEIFGRYRQNGQIDAFPRPNKASGAFCAHGLIVQPTYILLNHTDQLRDVLTLAHELGHGINNELIKEKQHALDFGITVATGEVASTFMEDFVLQELLETADPELRLSLQMMKLNDDVSSIFRQVACYRFEQRLHEEYRKTGYLSADTIGGIFQECMAAYMGEAVEQPAEAQNWWVYWSHIRSYFYVYSYASGLLISKYLQRQVRQNPAFIEKVVEFLQAGKSASPEEIFRRLGIEIADPAFWNGGLDEVDALLADTEQLARNLGKQKQK